MKTSAIEVWALKVLDALARGAPVEDSRVELKKEWPQDASRAARQLAALANAARLEPVLWLVGVDEKGGVAGAPYTELSNWFSSVAAHFDSVVPDMRSLNVIWKDQSVAALCFDTTRAPYLVRNGAFGKVSGDGVSWEIPWREAGSTRTARRNEILLMLSAAQRLPKIDLLSCEMLLVKEAKDGKEEQSLTITGELYFVPKDETLLVFPFHKTLVDVELDSRPLGSAASLNLEPAPRKRGDSEVLRMLRTFRDRSPAPTVNVATAHEVIEGTHDEILLRGPGKVKLRTEYPVPNGALNEAASPTLVLTLVEIVSEQSVILRAPFPKPVLRPHGCVWSLHPSPPDAL